MSGMEVLNLSCQKCISSTDKHGKDNSLSIGTGIGSILAACLLVAAGICTYRWFSNRRRDEKVSVRKSPKTKILRKIHVKPDRTGGTDTYSDDGYLKPVPSDKCHSSCPESCDSIERWKALVELEIRPLSHVEHVMRLHELYKRVKAGDLISLNGYLMNPPHVYKVISAKPGQDVFITM